MRLVYGLVIASVFAATLPCGGREGGEEERVFNQEITGMPNSYRLLAESRYQWLITFDTVDHEMSAPLMIRQYVINETRRLPKELAQKLVAQLIDSRNFSKTVPGEIRWDKVLYGVELSGPDGTIAVQFTSDLKAIRFMDRGSEASHTFQVTESLAKVLTEIIKKKE